MDVEEVLERIDGWGRYQKVIYFFACLPSIIGASVTVGYSWTAYIMEHRCLVDGCENPSNATYTAPFLNFTTPADSEHTWSRCRVYRRNSTAGCESDDFSHHQTEPCSHWVYDTSVMESTLVSEFDLVCDDESLQPLGNSLYFIGVGIGSILMGILSDRYGRKMTLLGGSVLTGLAGGAAAFAPNYATYTTLRFLAAIFQYGLFSAAFVLCTELTSVDVRAFCGIMINAFFAVGEALVGVFPIFMKDWKDLQLIYSLPAFLFVSYWFFLPESPRWLMVVNKPDKAENVLRNISKWNGTPFPEDLVRKEKSEEKNEIHTSETFIHAMKHPVLLKRAGILCVQWFVVSMVYYGIGMVSTDLGGDIYVDFILTMLIEIPSYLFCAFAINPLGRKLMIGGAFALSGLGTICAGLIIHISSEWLTTTLSLVGKFGAASAFSLMYLYTAELYPTGIRSVGIGVASTFGRLGSILAPFISDLGQGNATLPLCIFGVTGLVASGVTVLLPETSGHDLPTTITEAVSFGKGQSVLPIPCLLARRARRQAGLRGYDGPQREERPAAAQGTADLS